jgi:hypothetical protein
MATQPVSSKQQQESDFKLLPSLLSNAFDAVTGTFRGFLDHELGLGEVALSAEGQAHAQAIAAQEAPSNAVQVGATQFTLTTFALVGGIGLLIWLLLRS